MTNLKEMMQMTNLKEMMQTIKELRPVAMYKTLDEMMAAIKILKEQGENDEKTK